MPPRAVANVEEAADAGAKGEHYEQKEPAHQRLPDLEGADFEIGGPLECVASRRVDVRC